MNAITAIMQLIQRILDNHLQNLDQRAEEWVAMTNPVNQDGTVNPTAHDKLVMCLINTTHETIISTYNPAARTQDGRYNVIPPPLYIDLHLAFVANFQERNYATGLTTLSQTISFFQQNPDFNRENLPGLPPGIDKLTLEFTSYSPTDVNAIVGMLGMKYLPTAFYKLRMIPFDGQTFQGQTIPAVRMP